MNDTGKQSSDQAALEQAAEILHRLSSALETMQMGVTIADLDGRIVYTNRADAEMHGYTVKALLGKDVGVFAAGEHRHQLTLKELKKLKSWKREALNVRKDGSTFPVELLSDVVRDPAGEPVGVVTTCQDVTDRKQVEEAVQRLREREREMLEAQLRQAQKLEELGRLSGSIAHDFNNVLSVILTNVELALEEDAPRDDERRQVLADVRAAAESGAQLVRQLLSYSRREEPQLTQHDLRQVLQDLSIMLRRLTPASIELEVAVPDEELPVQVDLTGVQQMVWNLVSNARDALAQGGRIRVEVARVSDPPPAPAECQPAPSGDYVRLSVRDNGTGMDHQTLSRVFEPFFTTKPAGRGTGLGLATTQALMKKHGGFTRIESRLGEGTLVELYFPVDGMPEEAEHMDTPEANEIPQGTETILLVDDNDGLRSAARRALERLGYRVLEASDGDRALQVFEAHEPEIKLILSDVVMPRLSGPELYRAIRARNTDVRFLLASGYGPEAIKERTGSVGPMPLLQKPWTLAELAQKVRAVLSSTHASGTGWLPAHGYH